MLDKALNNCLCQTNHFTTCFTQIHLDWEVNVFVYSVKIKIFLDILAHMQLSIEWFPWSIIDMMGSFQTLVWENSNLTLYYTITITWCLRYLLKSLLHLSHHSFYTTPVTHDVVLSISKRCLFMTRNVMNISMDIFCLTTSAQWTLSWGEETICSACNKKTKNSE